jgi:methylase of polypeptide subunit release factors
MLIKLLGKLARYPHRWKLIAKWLFKVEFGPLQPSDYYYDFGSVALVGHAKKTLARKSVVLDLGCGANAVIGLALWRALDAKVLSVDINPTLVELARAAVKLNGDPFEVRKSRFFDSIDDFAFDTVIFNPPYVPTAAAAAIGLPEDRASQWQGGADGLSVADEFLRELAAYPRPVTALMSNNRMLVPRQRFNDFSAGHKGLEIVDVLHHRFIPIDVYTLVQRGQTADTP